MQRPRSHDAGRASAPARLTYGACAALAHLVYKSCGAPACLSAGAPLHCWLNRRPEPGFSACRKKRPAFGILFSSFTGEKMGLEDRDWYREEYKQKRRAEQQASSKSPPRYAYRPTNRPPPDLSAYAKVFTSDNTSPVKKPWYYIGLFLILCLAIYGALALLYYIQNPIKKQQQQQQQQHLQQPDTSKEKPKPAVRYL